MDGWVEGGGDLHRNFLFAVHVHLFGCACASFWLYMYILFEV